MLGPSSSSNADQWGVHQKTINHALTAQICSTNWLTLALSKYSLANDWFKVQNCLIGYFCFFCFGELKKSNIKYILQLWFIEPVLTSLCLVRGENYTETATAADFGWKETFQRITFREITNQIFWRNYEQNFLPHIQLTAAIYLQAIEKNFFYSP